MRFGSIFRGNRGGIEGNGSPDQILPVSDCAFECDSCTAKFPSSVKIERDGLLWGTAKPWRSHVLVATGKSDWAHGLEDEAGSLSTVLANWHPTTTGGKRTIVSNSSLPPPADYFTTTDRDKASNVFVLPAQITATNVRASVAQKVTDQLLAFNEPPVSTTKAALPEEIDGAKISRQDHLAVILLCSHRTRDKRCGVTAPILRKELELQLREHDLFRDATDDRPGGVPIYYVSHVGGHKFAGNVIIYRNTGDGIWMGRVEPKHCKAIVEETVIKGNVFPEYLRQAFKSEW
ncbi:Sucrase/ferredoxin-like-domain-containing protein [Lipomyces japonicus]|uniref:Sucrase/ferredoxin-like-domain-containing protein n=1 Tax=Lipomyces japonicus TaxID=56871 RepID=UPI0034CF6E88